MNITVVAVGTRGDVEPHAALCRALLRAGYHATLCAPADFAGDANTLRIPFHSIPVHFRHLVGSSEGGTLLASDANGLRLLRELRGVAAKGAGSVCTAVRDACQDADAEALGEGFRFVAHERGDANRSARVERPFSFIENNFLASFIGNFVS